jgi:hypothetical protein
MSIVPIVGGIRKLDGRISAGCLEFHLGKIVAVEVLVTSLVVLVSKEISTKADQFVTAPLTDFEGALDCCRVTFVAECNGSRIVLVGKKDWWSYP